MDAGPRPDLAPPMPALEAAVSASSAVLSLVAEGIPDALRDGRRFVAWRAEHRPGQPKPAKMPYSPNAPKGASSTAPAEWVTFEDAVRYAQVAGLDGIMRAFDPADGLTGIDLDNCRDPETGELAEWAAAIVKRLDTYTEISPSGTGVKLWALGALPAQGRKRGDVEMYDRARFFTMTGRQLPGTPSTVGYRPDAVLAIHRDIFGDTAATTITPAAETDPDRAIPALEIGDAEVIRLASASPHNGPRFRRLWSGDTSDYAVDGNDGESEADCGLAELLAYYGGPDHDRIDRLYRQSGLYRDKWERKDYRERTIKRALDGKTRFYGDSIKAQPAAAGSDGAAVCTCAECPAVARVAYLEGRLLDRDDLLEYQQAIVRNKHAELESKTAFLSHLTSVLAKPNDEMSASTKIVALALAYETHFRADRGRTKLPLVALVERTGLSKNTVSTASRDLAERDGSPFERRVTREFRRDEDGAPQWVTTVEFAPRTESTAATLQAVAKLPAPVDKPKHGGSAQAAAQRQLVREWGRCDRHGNTDVTVRGHCPDCGEVVGERQMSRSEFAALNPKLGDPAPATVSDGLKGHKLGDPERDVPLTHQLGDPAPPPPIYPAEMAGTNQVCETHGRILTAEERKRGACEWCVKGVPFVRLVVPGQRPTDVWRCPAVMPTGRECRALEYRILPDGARRCQGRGHVTGGLPAVAGGSD